LGVLPRRRLHWLATVIERNQDSGERIEGERHEASRG
jgi:hypothetical protein